MKTIFVSGLFVDRNKIFARILSEYFRIITFRNEKVFTEQQLLVEFAEDIVGIPAIAPEDIERLTQECVEFTADHLGQVLKKPSVSLPERFRHFAQVHARMTLQIESIFRQVVERQPIDLVLLASDSGTVKRTLAIVAKQMGIPTLNVEHGFGAIMPGPSALREGAHLPFRFLSDFVNFDNALEVEILQAHYLRSGPKEPIEFLSLGTPNDVSSPVQLHTEQARTLLGLDPNRPVIALAGSWVEVDLPFSIVQGKLEEIAIYQQILQTFAELQQKLHPVPQFIVKLHPVLTQTPTVQRVTQFFLKTAAKVGLQELKVFTNQLDHIIAAADVLVTPHLGSVLWEAFVVDTPGILFPQRGLLEQKFHPDKIIDSNPLYRQGCIRLPLSSEELKGQIQQLIQNPQEQERYRKAAVQIREQYRLEVRTAEEKSLAICEWIDTLLPERYRAIGQHQPPADMQPTVSIIIPVHNNLSYTRQCLEAIPETVGNVAYEVIVVDNASDQETAEYLQKEAAAGRIVLIRNERNESFARANNQGAAVAKGAVLVFLNNDTKPLDGWLEAILEEFRNHPEVGIVGAKLLYGNGRIQHAGMVFGARPGRPEEPFHVYLLADPDAPFVNRRRIVQFVTGACLAIRRDLFQQVGGFDEGYVFGWEDADLCMKVQQQGYQVVYQPKAVLYHYESVTKKLREQQGVASFADASPQERRNRERFFEKWGDVVRRDMEQFFAEDGFEIRGNQLVPKQMPAETRSPQTAQRKTESPFITSFNRRFWKRNYAAAKTVLVKSTDAFGDTLTITSVVRTLKQQYPHLQIFVAGKERTRDIFLHNPDIVAVVDIESPDAVSLEVVADEVIDYTDIIARLPEYYNGIGYRDIFGNLAGIPFRYEAIVYTVMPEEEAWAAQQITDAWGQKPAMLVGVHLISDKENVPNKRNYPYGMEVLEQLHQQFPAARFLHFGTAPLPSSEALPWILDAAAAGFSLRQQMALSRFCTHFLTIDSAFFHVGHNLWKKPTLLICGLTNPWLSGNPDAGFAFVRNESLDCLECYWQRQCGNECMVQLPPETVAKAFVQMVHDGVQPLPPLPGKRIRLTAGQDPERVIAEHLFLQKPAHRLELEDPEGVLPPYARWWNGVDVVGAHPQQQPVLEQHSSAEDPESAEAALRKAVAESGYTIVQWQKTPDGRITLEVVPQPVDAAHSQNEESSEQHPEAEGVDEGISSRVSTRTATAGNGMEEREKQADPTLNEKETLPALHVIWEGSQFVTHSLALINRQHCLNLLKVPGVELTVVPYEQDQFAPEGDPALEQLARCDVRNKAVDWERLKGVPTVWVRHQWPPKAEAPPIGKWVIMQPWEFSHLRRDFVEFFSKAVEIWTPSTFSREAMVRSGLPFDQVQVIPNGIDPQLFTPYGDAYPLPTQKRLRLLYVGGTIFRKGIDVLLAAYAKAFTASDDVVLVIKDMGGDSFYRGQTAQQLIQQFQQTPNAPEVLYIDQTLSPEEMAQLYRACTALVMPYRGEGFSLPTLEAMACGLAVVVTEGGATDDFVDEHVGWKIPAVRREIGDRIDGHPLTGTAWVLEPDQEALVKILHTLYDRPHEAFLRGVMGAQRARRFWTWHRATLKLLTRIDALVGTDLHRIARRYLRSREDAIIAVGMAEEALEQGTIDEAIQLYEAALTMRGLPVRYAELVLLRLAWLSLEEGEERLCEEFLAKVEDITPDHPDAEYIRAVQALRRQHWEEALGRLQRLMDNWKVWKFRSVLGYGLDTLLVDTATALFQSGSPDEARQLLSLSVQLHPQNQRAWHWLAEVAEAQGDHQAAAAFREKAMQNT